MDYQDDIIRRMQLTYFISETIAAYESNGRGPTLLELVEGAQRRAGRVGIRLTNVDITHHLDALESPVRNSVQNSDGKYSSVVESGWRLNNCNGIYYLTDRGKKDYKLIPLEMTLQLLDRATLANFLRKTRRNDGN